MKWNKAVELIEKALAQGFEVEVKYHRKWARNDMEKNRYGVVDCISTYDWKGEKLKVVILHDNSLDEGNFIIDEIYRWKGEK